MPEFDLCSGFSPDTERLFLAETLQPLFYLTVPVQPGSYLTRTFHMTSAGFLGKLLKQHHVLFLLSNNYFEKHFYDSLISRGLNSTPDTDGAPSSDLIENFITLVACPAPSHDRSSLSWLSLAALPIQTN